MSPVLPYYFIPVDVSKGMFSNEKSVLLHLANGNTVTLLADTSLLSERGNKYYLRVNLVDKVKKLVLLPVEPLNGSRWAEVSEIIS